MSSYSDPFYDRLEAIWQGIARRWPLVLLAVALIIAITIGMHLMLSWNPQGASQQRYLAILNDAQGDRSETLLAFAQTEDEVDSLRARAYLDLISILRSPRNTEGAPDLETLRSYAASAAELTAASGGRLHEAALLAQGQLAFEAGDLEAASGLLAQVRGAESAQLRVDAAMTLALIHEREGDLASAIDELDFVIDVLPVEQRGLADLAAVHKARLERQQQEIDLAMEEPAGETADEPADDAPATDAAATEASTDEAAEAADADDAPAELQIDSSE